jgi:hypothetical protein
MGIRILLSSNKRSKKNQLQHPSLPHPAPFIQFPIHSKYLEPRYLYCNTCPNRMIRTVCFLSLLDPDPLVRDTGTDPDPLIIKKKIVKKTASPPSPPHPASFPQFQTHSKYNEPVVLL